MYDLVEQLRVVPGAHLDLRRDHHPADTGGIESKEEASVLLKDGLGLLVDYQDRLFAQNLFAVVLVLQGLDASGKDSTIKHVMSGVNPQGVDVHSFKEPSRDELARDFLWRYQREVPARGRIGIFNRSHYEEVLVLRVHPELLVTEHIPLRERQGDIWHRRYRQINEWERHLVENGIHIAKVFLHLSKEEQARRFLRRIDDPKRNWKFSPSDVHERAYFDEYQSAFEHMLRNTSTEWAPWHVVPADHKWFTRLATAAVLIATLAGIDPQYPEVAPEVLREMTRVREDLIDETKG